MKGLGNNKDFKINKMLRACDQKAAASKPTGGKKDVLEYKTSLHKLTV